MTLVRKKLINLILALLVITALILMQGCAKEEEVDPEDIIPVVNEINLTTYNDFALKLLRNSGYSDENFIISPVSMGTTLALLRMGADGNTAAQIDEMLEMTIDDYDLVALQCSQLFSKVSELSGIWYEMGMNLYVDEGPSIRESYAVTAEDSFGLGIEFMNFDIDSAEVDMNDWVDITTSGRIETILDENELQEDLVTLLINLNALECEWEVAFDDSNTRPLPFEMYDGRNVAVPMMRGKLNMSYYNDDDVTALFIPMSGQQTSLAIIMPPEEELLSTFINYLTAEDIELWRYVAAQEERYINLPQITWEKRISVKEMLTEMGAGDMFDPELADFSQMGANFYLGDMWQTTVFTAEESGAEEANVTAVDLTRAQGEGAEFITINRPFMIAVIDNETGGILMIGTVANPVEKSE